MPDMCLCRLVVSGPTFDVMRFVQAAAPAERSVSARGSRDDEGPLSFRELLPLREEDDPVDVYGTPSRGPDDCWRDALSRDTAGRASIHYGFLTTMSEPYRLIRHVSRQFVRLDFLLGAVAPAIDEANCWYFRGGRGRNWKMPARQREAIRCRVWDGAGLAPEDEGNLDVDVQGDHAMMEQVIARWTPARKRVAMRIRRHHR